MSAKSLKILGSLSILVASLLLVMALWDAWQRYRNFQEGSRVSTGPADTVVSVENNVYSIDNIVSAHLFGVQQSASTAVTAAPKTRLKLNLMGLVASDDPRFARALIGLESAPPQSYAVGDEITRTDARVHAVERERVLLDRAGRIESLALDRVELANTPPETAEGANQ